jgi:SAM-dependent methyltransferase
MLSSETLPVSNNERSVDLESAPCPMGCAPDDEQLFVGRDRMHGKPGSFPVVRCRRCRLVRTTPRPTLDGAGFYYPDVYAPYHLQEAATSVPKRSGALDGWRRRLRLDGTRELLPAGLQPGRALEIGCASGAFLAKLRSRGWQVQGIEPSVAAAERASALGLQVYTGPIETAPDPQGQFDLVVASHSLEHLHDPLGSLRRVRQWCRPGALLSCAIPDAGGFLFRRFGADWYDLDVPRHLFHFTPATFTNLLALAGWKAERIRGQRTLNSVLGTFGNVLGDRTRPAARRLARLCFNLIDGRSPLKPLLTPVTAALAAFRQTGRMKIVARAV